MKFKTICSCVHAFIRGLFLEQRNARTQKNEVQFYIYTLKQRLNLLL